MLEKSIASQQKGFAHIAIIIALVIILVIVGGVLWQHMSHLPKGIEGTKPNNVTQQPLKGSVTQASSSTWAGYMTGSEYSFTSAQGRVKIPKIICHSIYDAFSVWVGFDGYANDTVEQIGVNVNCDQGYTSIKGSSYVDGAVYSAFAMMFGAGAYDTLPLSVHPGDMMFYKVSYENNQFVMTLRNETINQSKTVSYQCQLEDKSSVESSNPCPRSTAEWIVERGGMGSLAEFSNVTLYDNQATDSNGATHSLNSLDMIQLVMSHNGRVLAVPSSLINKNDFSLQWLQAGEVGQ